MRTIFSLITTCVLLALGFQAVAQGSANTLLLQNLTDFRPQAGNWMIVGDVVINPEVDIHEKPEPPAAPITKKIKNLQRL